MGWGGGGTADWLWYPELGVLVRAMSPKKKKVNVQISRLAILGQSATVKATVINPDRCNLSFGNVKVHIHRHSPSSKG